MEEQIFLTAEIEVDGTIDKVWELWNNPEAIVQWNNLSEEWHCPEAVNNLKPGGRFLYVMGLKDGSFKFNFEGTYDDVKPHELITYTLDDGRKSKISFKNDSPVKITETFEADKTQPAAMQKTYCQAVLDSFKAYVEKAT